MEIPWEESQAPQEPDDEEGQNPPEPEDPYVYAGTVYFSRAECATKLANDVVVCQDYVDRRLAVAELNKLGLDALPHTDVLVKALQDDDAGVRYWAAVSLAGLGSEATVDPGALAKLLEDTDPGIRYWAVVTLSFAGAAARPHVAALTTALMDADPHVRVASTKALVAIEPAVLAEVADVHATCVAHIRSESYERGSAAEGLGALGSAAHPHAEALGTCLLDTYTTVRTAAADALMSLGIDAVRPVASALAKAANSDSDIGVRSAASAALDKLGPAEALLVDNGDLRFWAVRTIAGLGPKAVAHAPMLAEAMKDSDHGVRYWAAEALGHTGDAAVEYEELLMAAIEDENPTVRIAAMKALVAVRPSAVPKAAETTATFLNHKVAVFRSSAAEALAATGDMAEPHAVPLADALEDQDPSVRLNAVLALCGAGRPSVRRGGTAMGKIANDDPESDVRRAAEETLFQHGLHIKFKVKKYLR